MSESVQERQMINGEKECGIHTGRSDRISLAGGGRVNQFSGDTPESLIQFIPVGLRVNQGDFFGPAANRSFFFPINLLL